MLYTIVAVLVIILDQWVKYWVAGNIPVGSGIKELIPGVISLVNVHNDGAAFSFLSGSGARIYFIIICGVFTVGVIIALATRLINGPVGRWSAVLVVAGGLGNCIDRVLYGYVQDMFKVELFDFAVFNVADIFITLFCFIFILYVLFGGQKSHDYDDDDVQYDEDDEEEDDVSFFSRFRKEPEDESPAGRRQTQPSSRSGNPQKSSTRSSSSGKQPKKTRYDEEYEQYKASRAARQRELTDQDYDDVPPVRSSQPARRESVRPVETGEDPFAEWERASARVAAQKHDYAAAAAGQVPSRQTQQRSSSARPQASSQQASRQRPQQSRSDEYETAQQSARKAQQSRPAEYETDQQVQRQRTQPARPAQYETPARNTTPAPKSSGDEFSLDDILNEFM